MTKDAFIEWKQDHCANMVQNIRDATWDPAVKKIVRLMLDTRAGGNTIFIAGNGGSAAMANHFAIDVNKVANSGGGMARFRCQSLAANISELSAWGNDVGFAEVFTAQLHVLARRGDLVILVSASGTSPNIIETGGWCRANHIKSVLLSSTMHPASEIAPADVTFCVRDNHYGRIEDTHMYVLHLLCYAFKDELEV